jgi:cytidylate kinase
MEKFFDYFDGRYRDSILNKPPADDGPVITISRLTGCDARQIAEIVVDNLNRKSDKPKWRWIDKDIIHAIAKELNTNSERVENFYNGIELSSISEMIMAFSGGFISDLRVKKAIKDVILSICKEGHIVLVGRGGVAIARGIQDALHIRIVAPFYWRVGNIMKKQNTDLETAEEYVVRTDECRHNLIQTFLEKQARNIDYLFDSMINRSSFSVTETAELIVSMYEKKISRLNSEKKIKQRVI